MMKKMIICVAVTTLLSLLNAEDIAVRTPSGETLTVEVPSEISLCDFFQLVDQQISEVEGTGLQASPRQFFIDYMYSPGKQSRNEKRDYHKPITSKEEKDIRYIILTIASSSWTTLLGEHTSITRAGDRVDHVHPFRFLMCIFSDEEMKTGIHSIRERRRIWNEFIEGLFDSLDEEAEKDNVNEHITHFANSLNIKSTIIESSLKNGRWDTFLDLLLEHLPRKGNPKRYDQ